MKIITLLGLIIVVITFLGVAELNGSLATQQELLNESVIELESSENGFDCDAAFLTKEIVLLSVEPKSLYDYKSDFILFDLSKDLFVPFSRIVFLQFIQSNKNITNKEHYASQKDS